MNMRPLPKLPTFGAKVRPLGQPPRGKQIKRPGPPNYAKVREGVMVAIAQLSPAKQSLIPMAGTLPEIIVALALCWLDMPFQAQIGELGGRLYLGGGVVDFKVWLGGTIVVIRVQGDYWHSLPERKYKDAVQWQRLHMLRYRVVDIWESDLYVAWIEGRLKTFVESAIANAA